MKLAIIWLLAGAMALTAQEPAPGVKNMPTDAKPVFEVATIRPARTEERFRLVVPGGVLTTTATSVMDLLKFAYDLHQRQIIGGPSWMETEKFDITAKPDIAGLPGMGQLKGMIRQLLADRFGLAFHNEKKELPVYAITVLKTGIKIAKDESDTSGLPTFGLAVQGVNIHNSTMAEFGTVMEAGILDKPVVDQTGLGATRYDFVLKFTRDPSQGIVDPGPKTEGPGDPDAPPDLFTAFQQQLGLKLESTKARVDVMVIDRLTRPSDN